MPLTTYTAGEVLTAASLNANLSFAASNPPSGLAFISSTTVSAATSISLPASTFTATYANYRLQLQITALTTDATFTIRMRAAGADNTTSNYSTMFMGIDSTGTARNEVNANTNTWVFGELDAVSHPDKYSLTIDVNNPQLTLPTTILGGYSFQQPSRYDSRYEKLLKLLKRRCSPF